MSDAAFCDHPRMAAPRWDGGDAEGHHANALRGVLSLLHWTGYEGKIRVPYGLLVDAPALVPTAHMFVGSKAPR